MQNIHHGEGSSLAFVRQSIIVETDSLSDLERHFQMLTNGVIGVICIRDLNEMERYGNKRRGWMYCVFSETITGNYRVH